MGAEAIAFRPDRTTPFAAIGQSPRMTLRRLTPACMIDKADVTGNADPRGSPFPEREPGSGQVTWEEPAHRGAAVSYPFAFATLKRTIGPLCMLVLSRKGRSSRPGPPPAGQWRPKSRCQTGRQGGEEA